MTMQDILFFQEKFKTGLTIIKTSTLILLFKDGTVRDISEVDNALINQSLFGTVKKFYICFIKMDITNIA